MFRVKGLGHSALCGGSCIEGFFVSAQRVVQNLALVVFGRVLELPTLLVELIGLFGVQGLA